MTTPIIMRVFNKVLPTDVAVVSATSGWKGVYTLKKKRQLHNKYDLEERPNIQTIVCKHFQACIEKNERI